MKFELLKRNYIYADGTVLKVLNNSGKDAKSNKYMWLYMSNILKKFRYTIDTKF